MSQVANIPRAEHRHGGAEVITPASGRVWVLAQEQ